MLIEEYILEVFTPACSPGEERFAAKARLATDISEVLPYLNATLHGARYTHAARALTWTKTGHHVAFHPFEIAVSNVEDRAAARQELEGLIDLVNHTWERRSEIAPDEQLRQPATPMAVFKLLPGSNCKQCGEPTCFNFALKLVAGQKHIADCPPLLEPEHVHSRTALQSLLGAEPAGA